MSQVLKRVTRKSDSFEAKNKERKGGSSLLHSTINMKKNKKTHILIYFIVHFCALSHLVVIWQEMKVISLDFWNDLNYCINI